jgi:hypothetical protein
VIRESSNSAWGGREWRGFGKRDDFANGQHEVRAGKEMGAGHAVFLELTTATAPIRILMTGLHLGATGSNGQSFNKAILWNGHVIQRKPKQEERNEFDPTVHQYCGNCISLAPDGLRS